MNFNYFKSCFLKIIKLVEILVDGWKFVSFYGIKSFINRN